MCSWNKTGNRVIFKADSKQTVKRNTYLIIKTERKDKK